MTKEALSVYGTIICWFCIPSKVDNRPFTLTQLGMLAQRYFPNQKAGYRYYNKSVESQFGSEPPASSYWVLLTRNILKDTRGKVYADQRELVQEYSGAGYGLPSALEAATSILTHYARSDRRQERLFGDNPWTYTCCRPTELVDDNWPLVVGGFEPAGLDVDFSRYGNDVRGVACCRKF